MSGTAEPLYQRHWLSVDDYLRMGEAGILGEDDRVELIGGEIVDMPHRHATHQCGQAHRQSAHSDHRGRAVVGVQDPIQIGDFSAPQRDISMLRPRDDFYATRHPGPADIPLLIEVAESSLAYDPDKKLPLYARNRILETWLPPVTDTAGETAKSSLTRRKDGVTI